MLFNSLEKKAYIGFWEDNKQSGLGMFINDNRVIYDYQLMVQDLMKTFKKIV